MGTTAPTGAIFGVSDLHKLIQKEHEIGCHTFNHYNAWETAPSEFQASIVQNREALDRYLPGAFFRNFSYPISCPRPRTKRMMSKYFDCCRGGGQTLNAGSLDLNFLKAFFLEKSSGDFDSIARLIERNSRERGWLIFATHDVSKRPTKFGCTPQFFEQVVRCAISSGATILTVCGALEKVRGKPSHASASELALDRRASGAKPAP